MRIKTQNQPYVYPLGLFDSALPREPEFWTIVRVKPRWEKKFARLLEGQRMPHFLPVYEKTVVSHRKKVTSVNPFFAGYIFVLGNREKKEFIETQSVAYLLKPSGTREIKLLDEQIAGVWRCLKEGVPVELVEEYNPGETVRVLNGPLKGVTGIYKGKNKSGRLILWVDILGAGVSAELDGGIMIEKMD